MELKVNYSTGATFPLDVTIVSYQEMEAERNDWTKFTLLILSGDQEDWLPLGEVGVFLLTGS